MRNILKSRWFIGCALTALMTLCGCGRSNRGMESSDINRLYAQDIWSNIIIAETESASVDEPSFIKRVATECVPKVIARSDSRNGTDLILVNPAVDLWKAAINGDKRNELTQVAILLRFRDENMKESVVALSFVGERLNGSAVSESERNQMRTVFPLPPALRQ